MVCFLKSIITWKMFGTPARTGSPPGEVGESAGQGGDTPSPACASPWAAPLQVREKKKQTSGIRLPGAGTQGGKGEPPSPQGPGGGSSEGTATHRHPLPLGQPISCLSGCGSQAGPSVEQGGHHQETPEQRRGQSSVTLLARVRLPPVSAQLIPSGRGSAAFPAGPGWDPINGAPGESAAVGRNLPQPGEAENRAAAVNTAGPSSPPGGREITFKINKTQTRCHVKQRSPRDLRLQAALPLSWLRGHGQTLIPGESEQNPTAPALSLPCPCPARLPSPGSRGAQSAHGDIARRIGFARPAGSI